LAAVKAADQRTSKTDPTPYPDADDDRGVGSDRGSAAGTPRWMSVLGIVVVVLVVLVFFVLHLTGTVGSGAH
jgi:hypothetical protein